MIVHQRRRCFLFNFGSGLIDVEKCEDVLRSGRQPYERWVESLKEVPLETLDRTLMQAT
jgi:hypothetical protein